MKTFFLKKIALDISSVWNDLVRNMPDAVKFMITRPESRSKDGFQACLNVLNGYRSYASYANGERPQHGVDFWRNLLAQIYDHRGLFQQGTRLTEDKVMQAVIASVIDFVGMHAMGTGNFELAVVAYETLLIGDASVFSSVGTALAKMADEPHSLINNYGLQFLKGNAVQNRKPEIQFRFAIATYKLAIDQKLAGSQNDVTAQKTKQNADEILDFYFTQLKQRHPGIKEKLKLKRYRFDGDAKLAADALLTHAMGLSLFETKGNQSRLDDIIKTIETIPRARESVGSRQSDHTLLDWIAFADFRFHRERLIHVFSTHYLNSGKPNVAADLYSGLTDPRDRLTHQFLASKSGQTAAEAVIRFGPTDAWMGVPNVAGECARFLTASIPEDISQRLVRLIFHLWLDHSHFSGAPFTATTGGAVDLPCNHRVKPSEIKVEKNTKFVSIYANQDVCPCCNARSLEKERVLVVIRPQPIFRSELPTESVDVCAELVKIITVYTAWNHWTNIPPGVRKQLDTIWTTPELSVLRDQLKRPDGIAILGRLAPQPFNELQDSSFSPRDRQLLWIHSICSGNKMGRNVVESLSQRFLGELNRDIAHLPPVTRDGFPSELTMGSFLIAALLKNDTHSLEWRFSQVGLIWAKGFRLPQKFDLSVGIETAKDWVEVIANGARHSDFSPETGWADAVIRGVFVCQPDGSTMRLAHFVFRDLGGDAPTQWVAEAMIHATATCTNLTTKAARARFLFRWFEDGAIHHNQSHTLARAKQLFESGLRPGSSFTLDFKGFDLDSFYETLQQAPQPASAFQFETGWAALVIWQYGFVGIGDDEFVPFWDWLIKQPATNTRAWVLDRLRDGLPRTETGLQPMGNDVMDTLATLMTDLNRRGSGLVNDYVAWWSDGFRPRPELSLTFSPGNRSLHPLLKEIVTQASNQNSVHEWVLDFITRLPLDAFERWLKIPTFSNIASSSLPYFQETFLARLVTELQSGQELNKKLIERLSPFKDYPATALSPLGWVTLWNHSVFVSSSRFQTATQLFQGFQITPFGVELIRAAANQSLFHALRLIFNVNPVPFSFKNHPIPFDRLIAWNTSFPDNDPSDDRFVLVGQLLRYEVPRVVSADVPTRLFRLARIGLAHLETEAEDNALSQTIPKTLDCLDRTMAEDDLDQRQLLQDCIVRYPTEMRIDLLRRFDPVQIGPVVRMAIRDGLLSRFVARPQFAVREQMLFSAYLSQEDWVRFVRDRHPDHPIPTDVLTHFLSDPTRFDVFFERGILPAEAEVYDRVVTALLALSDTHPAQLFPFVNQSLVWLTNRHSADWDPILLCNAKVVQIFSQLLDTTDGVPNFANHDFFLRLGDALNRSVGISGHAGLVGQWLSILVRLGQLDNAATFANRLNDRLLGNVFATIVLSDDGLSELAIAAFRLRLLKVFGELLVARPDRCPTIWTPVVTASLLNWSNDAAYATRLIKNIEGPLTPTLMAPFVRADLETDVRHALVFRNRLIPWRSADLRGIVPFLSPEDWATYWGSNPQLALNDLAFLAQNPVYIQRTLTGGNAETIRRLGVGVFSRFDDSDQLELSVSQRVEWAEQIAIGLNERPNDWGPVLIENQTWVSGIDRLIDDVTRISDLLPKNPNFFVTLSNSFTPFWSRWVSVMVSGDRGDVAIQLMERAQGSRLVPDIPLPSSRLGPLVQCILRVDSVPAATLLSRWMPGWLDASIDEVFPIQRGRTTPISKVQQFAISTSLQLWQIGAPVPKTFQRISPYLTLAQWHALLGRDLMFSDRIWHALMHNPQGLLAMIQSDRWSVDDPNGHLARQVFKLALALRDAPEAPFPDGFFDLFWDHAGIGTDETPTELEALLASISAFPLAHHTVVDLTGLKLGHWSRPAASVLIGTQSVLERPWVEWVTRLVNQVVDTARNDQTHRGLNAQGMDLMFHTGLSVIQRRQVGGPGFNEIDFIDQRLVVLRDHESLPPGPWADLARSWYQTLIRRKLREQFTFLTGELPEISLDVIKSLIGDTAGPLPITDAPTFRAQVAFLWGTFIGYLRKTVVDTFSPIRDISFDQNQLAHAEALVNGYCGALTALAELNDSLVYQVFVDNRLNTQFQHDAFDHLFQIPEYLKDIQSFDKNGFQMQKRKEFLSDSFFTRPSDPPAPSSPKSMRPTPEALVALLRHPHFQAPSALLKTDLFVGQGDTQVAIKEKEQAYVTGFWKQILGATAPDQWVVIPSCQWRDESGGNTFGVTVFMPMTTTMSGHRDFRIVHINTGDGAKYHAPHTVKAGESIFKVKRSPILAKVATLNLDDSPPDWFFYLLKSGWVQHFVNHSLDADTFYEGIWPVVPGVTIETPHAAVFNRTVARGYSTPAQLVKNLALMSVLCPEWRTEAPASHADRQAKRQYKFMVALFHNWLGEHVANQFGLIPSAGVPLSDSTMKALSDPAIKVLSELRHKIASNCVKLVTDMGSDTTFLIAQSERVGGLIDAGVAFAEANTSAPDVFSGLSQPVSASFPTRPLQQAVHRSLDAVVDTVFPPRLPESLTIREAEANWWKSWVPNFSTTNVSLQIAEIETWVMTAVATPLPEDLDRAVLSRTINQLAIIGDTYFSAYQRAYNLIDGGVRRILTVVSLFCLANHFIRIHPDLKAMLAGYRVDFLEAGVNLNQILNQMVVPDPQVLNWYRRVSELMDAFDQPLEPGVPRVSIFGASGAFITGDVDLSASDLKAMPLIGRLSELIDRNPAVGSLFNEYYAMEWIVKSHVAIPDAELLRSTVALHDRATHPDFCKNSAFDPDVQAFEMVRLMRMVEFNWFPALKNWAMLVRTVAAATAFESWYTHVNRGVSFSLKKNRESVRIENSLRRRKGGALQSRYLTDEFKRLTAKRYRENEGRIEFQHHPQATDSRWDVWVSAVSTDATLMRVERVYTLLRSGFLDLKLPDHVHFICQLLWETVDAQPDTYTENQLGTASIRYTLAKRPKLIAGLIQLLFQRFDVEKAKKMGDIAMISALQLVIPLLAHTGQLSQYEDELITRFNDVISRTVTASGKPSDRARLILTHALLAVMDASGCLSGRLLEPIIEMVGWLRKYEHLGYSDDPVRFPVATARIDRLMAQLAPAINAHLQSGPAATSVLTRVCACRAPDRLDALTGDWRLGDRGWRNGPFVVNPLSVEVYFNGRAIGVLPEQCLSDSHFNAYLGADRFEVTLDSATGRYQSLGMPVRYFFWPVNPLRPAQESDAVSPVAIRLKISSQKVIYDGKEYLLLNPNQLNGTPPRDLSEIRSAMDSFLGSGPAPTGLGHGGYRIFCGQANQYVAVANANEAHVVHVSVSENQTVASRLVPWEGAVVPVPLGSDAIRLIPHNVAESGIRICRETAEGMALAIPLWVAHALLPYSATRDEVGISKQYWATKKQLVVLDRATNEILYTLGLSPDGTVPLGTLKDHRAGGVFLGQVSTLPDEKTKARLAAFFPLTETELSGHLIQSDGDAPSIVPTTIKYPDCGLSIRIGEENTGVLSGYVLANTQSISSWRGFGEYLMLRPVGSPSVDLSPVKLVFPVTLPARGSTEGGGSPGWEMVARGPIRKDWVSATYKPAIKRFVADTDLGTIHLAHVFFQSATLEKSRYTDLNGYQMAAELLAEMSTQKPYSPDIYRSLYMMMSSGNTHRNAIAIRLRALALVKNSESLSVLYPGHVPFLYPDLSADYARYNTLIHRIDQSCRLTPAELVILSNHFGAPNYPASTAWKSMDEMVFAAGLDGPIPRQFQSGGVGLSSVYPTMWRWHQWAISTSTWISLHDMILENKISINDARFLIRSMAVKLAQSKPLDRNKLWMVKVLSIVNEHRHAAIERGVPSSPTLLNFVSPEQMFIPDEDLVQLFEPCHALSWEDCRAWVRHFVADYGSSTTNEFGTGTLFKAPDSQSWTQVVDARLGSLAIGNMATRQTVLKSMATRLTRGDAAQQSAAFITQVAQFCVGRLPFVGEMAVAGPESTSSLPNPLNVLLNPSVSEDGMQVSFKFSQKDDGLVNPDRLGEDTDWVTIQTRFQWRLAATHPTTLTGGL